MAISKIKINGTTHDIQTTIANVTNLQSSLDAKQSIITGAATTVTGSNLTANRALVSNSSGKIAVSDITSTELNYLDNATSNIQTQLNNRTLTSVMPNDAGEVKTKYRIAQKGYAGTATWYYKICDLPANDSGNYASAIVTGRMGGWSTENISYINSLIWNRSVPGISLIDIAGTASTMNDVWKTADLVLYVNGTSTTAVNTATLYIKCAGYFVFDLDLELYQSTATITYDGTYITTTPSGTLAAQASITNKRVEVVKSQLLVNGTALLPVTGNAASATKATQDANGNIITSTYETKTDATARLNEAKTYAANQAAQVKNDLLNGAGEAYDTLKELGDLIDTNSTAIDALETVASNKMDKMNPVGEGTFSFGRLSGSTTGARSITLGSNATASGKDSVAIGRHASAEADYATAIGYGTEAAGYMSTAMGYLNQATGGAQMVFGSLNIPDTNDAGPENRTENILIVGNGVYGASTETRSNAMTLGWDGTAWFSGDVYVGSTSGTNLDTGSKKLITADEVLITIEDIDEICGNSIQSASSLTY